MNPLYALAIIGILFIAYGLYTTSSADHFTPKLLGHKQTDSAKWGAPWVQLPGVGSAAVNACQTAYNIAPSGDTYLVQNPGTSGAACYRWVAPDAGQLSTSNAINNAPIQTVSYTNAQIVANNLVKLISYGGQSANNLAGCTKARQLSFSTNPVMWNSAIGPAQGCYTKW